MECQLLFYYRKTGGLIEQFIRQAQTIHTSLNNIKTLNYIMLLYWQTKGVETHLYPFAGSLKINSNIELYE